MEIEGQMYSKGTTKIRIFDQSHSHVYRLVIKICNYFDFDALFFKAAFLKGLTGGFRDDLVCLVGGRTDSGLCEVSVWSDLASLRCWLCPEAFFKLSCSSQSSSLTSSEMKLLLATVPPDRQSPSSIIPGPSMLFGQLSVGCSSPKGSFVNIISGKVCTLA